MSELFLADENFPVATVRFLRERGDDVIHALETFSGPGRAPCACADEPAEDGARRPTSQ